MYSDDPDWCRSELKLDRPFTVVDPGSPAQDLRAMARHRHIVIANSSFSWWAAWLRREPGITIAPKHWFRMGVSTEDLIPDGWLRA